MSHLVSLNGVAKYFGSQEVLQEVSWQFGDRVRAALVGRNGAGKTTLFRLLTGSLEPDGGSLLIRRGAVITTMEQDVFADDGRTLREEASRGLKHVEELEQEFVAVTTAMAGVTEGDPEGKDLLERYAYLEERLRREDAYSADARIRAVLDGLHFTETDLDRPLAEFSGGQKSRAALARVLLRDPDLLLLDEPTNHLDLDAIEWLETFLESYKGAYILVSHDRVFLNRLAREVVELRNGKLHRYQGNYDAFLVERERRLEDQARRYEMQQEEIRRTEVFIQKNIAGQKTKQAQSRRNRLERMERLEAPEWPASSITMRLPEPERSARNVVEARRLAKRYGTLQVFRDLSFLLLRGQKVGMVGPNGVGKSTLLRLLVGQEGPDEGKLQIGPGVEIGYYEQEQTALRGPQSVLEEVWKVTPQATEGEMRTYLGSFLFHGDDVFKALNHLSGGERSRVALAKLVRRGSNLLILDEPTNHLDIESRAVMEKALEAYRGTLLVASHDRAFLSRVTDHVLELSTDGCRMWEGGFERYAAERRRRRQVEKPAAAAMPQAADVEAATSKEERKRGYEDARRRKREEERLRKRVSEAEDDVMHLEEAKENLLAEMADPAVATDSERLGELHARLREQETALTRAISEWERLAARLEAFLDAPP